jgi:tetratricopeptide (TPR) repeat protein
LCGQDFACFDGFGPPSYVFRMRNEHAFAAAAAAFLLASLLISGATAQDVRPPPRIGNGAGPGIETGPVPDAQEAPGPRSAVPDIPDLQSPDPQADDGGSDPRPSDQALPGPEMPAPVAPGPKAPGPAAKKKAAEVAPKDKDAMLTELYAHLAKAPDADQAAEISKTIEGLWLHSGSDTIGVLMRRGLKAVNEQRNDLALKMFDAVVELAPDYAEGWSRRAYVYFLQSDTEHAVGDLRRALALDPNHYKALDGLARILRDSGQKKSALRAYQQLLRINPFADGAKEAESALSVEVEGQGI